MELINKMYRRHFVVGTLAGALQAISGQPVHAQPTALAFTTRLADAIWQDLASAEIRELEELAGTLSVEHGHSNPPELSKRVAADFRTGSTLLVKRVRLSRTELAWYLLRAGYF